MDDKSLEYTISRSVSFTSCFYFSLFLYYRLRQLLLAAEHQRMVDSIFSFCKEFWLTFFSQRVEFDIMKLLDTWQNPYVLVDWHCFHPHGHCTQCLRLTTHALQSGEIQLPFLSTSSHLFLTSGGSLHVQHLSLSLSMLGFVFYFCRHSNKTWEIRVICHQFSARRYSHVLY
jgi:hypothetical protein